MAALEEQRTIARCQTTESVSGGVTHGVSFRFDNAATGSASRNFVNQRLSDEEPRQFNGVYGQLRAAQAAKQSRTLPHGHALLPQPIGNDDIHRLASDRDGG